MLRKALLKLTHLDLSGNVWKDISTLRPLKTLDDLKISNLLTVRSLT